MDKKNSIGCQSKSKLCDFRKRFGIILAALLTLSIFAAAAWDSSILTVRAATDSETTLEIYKGQAEAAEPFSVNNMFPGDRTEKEYNVQVSYTGEITLHFHADIRPGYEKLAEVLKCQIRVADKEVYDGLMRDMPGQLDHLLSSSKGTTETVPYDIAVYLDTSVGNDYQNKELICDFRWWVEVDAQPDVPDDPDRPDHPDKPDRPDRPDRPDHPDKPETPSKPQRPGELIDPPKTGDTIMVWVLILALSGSILVLLFAKRKKEEDSDAGK